MKKDKVEIKKSRNGKGVFAVKKFSKGEDIFEIKGKFISGDVDEDIDEKTRDNSIRFDKEKYISPAGETAEFINHSCRPNSAVVKRRNKLFVIAVNDIKPKEEITFDYSTICAPDDIWEMDCNCGHDNCRIKIKQFKTLPKILRQKYISLGMVPDYIL